MSLTRTSSRLASPWIALALAATLAAPLAASADTVSNNVVGAGGYDLTTYFSSEKPARGNGHHVAVHDGVTYLFTSDENKKKFERSPEKFLPVYGGYCAYGASLGKKFAADPDVYDVVDGKLYFNLDSKIRGIWSKDIAGYINKANAQWKGIERKNPGDL